MLSHPKENCKTPETPVSRNPDLENHRTVFDLLVARLPGQASASLDVFVLHELLVVEIRAYLDSALVTKIIGRRMNPKITRTGRIETEAEAAHRSGRKVEERFCIRQFGVQPIGQYVMIFWRLYDFL